MVKSIDLVNKDGIVNLAVRVRRPLPFLRPKEYIIAPYQFQMDRAFVQQLDEPEFMNGDGSSSRGILSSIGRGFSKAIFYPFAATRRLLTMEGFMYVTLNDGGPKVKLDTQGTFSNGAKDLVEMGTIIL
jgi:hypothetical protein